MKEHLDEASRQEIIKYRVEKSDSAIREADILARNEFFDNAVTRLYYACYYLASALLIKEGIETTSHAGVKRMFSLKFIRNGVLDQKYFQILSNLLQGRQLSDYEDFIYQDKESYNLYRSEAINFCQKLKHY